MSKETILEKLPEVSNNAQGYFTYATTPVIEESVNRGDAREPQGLVAGDITADDIKELVDAAMVLIDKRLLEYSRKEAIADAVLMAIGTFKDGKWQSKITPNVADLIASQTDKALSGKKETKIEKSKDQNDDTMALAKQASAPNVSTVSDSGKLTKVPPAKARQMVAPRVLRQVAGPVLVVKNAMDRLDGIASRIQELGLVKLAEQVDMITNTLEGVHKKAGEMSYLKTKHPYLWDLSEKKEKNALGQLSGEDYQVFIAKAEEFANDHKVKSFLTPEEKVKLDSSIARLKTNSTGSDAIIAAILGIVTNIKDAPSI
jgi:hypothetical protein